MNILVTGHNGYIGPHLIGLLQKQGHTVTGVDLNIFVDNAWEQLPKPNKELIKDYRLLTHEELIGHDCVIHLAAISNDPMGNLVEELTYANNRKGSIDLAEKSKNAGVKRFLFSGSCSVYGKGETLDLDENANLHPITAYAHSKIDTETAVSKMADDSFSPVFLRNSTAYGYSPNLRIDLVVNNLLACAFANGNIQIQSDGSPWRPLIHCKDIARAFSAFVDSPWKTGHNMAINIGGNNENYQVKHVADFVQNLIPNAKIIYTNEVGDDPRNYRVNFDLLNKVLPDFKLEYTLETGMKELLLKYEEHNFSKDDFNGDSFVRLRTLKDKLHLFNNVKM
jgi:nucleoside-diphosphate-sugar epimerase